jgi:hypothetical protein
MSSAVGAVNRGVGTDIPVKRISPNDKTMMPGFSKMTGVYQIFDLIRLKSKELLGSLVTPARFFPEEN